MRGALLGTLLDALIGALFRLAAGGVQRDAVPVDFVDSVAYWRSDAYASGARGQ